MTEPLGFSEFVKDRFLTDKSKDRGLFIDLNNDVMN